MYEYQRVRFKEIYDANANVVEKYERCWDVCTSTGALANGYINTDKIDDVVNMPILSTIKNQAETVTLKSMV